MKNVIIIVIIALLCITPVLADYNFYPQFGGDDGIGRRVLGSGTTTFSQITQISNTGSLLEPIAQDVNGDGITELFVQGNNTLQVYDGSTLNIISEVSIGQMEINPVLCDINTDGITEFIGVSDYAGNKTLFVAKVEDGELTVIATRPVNATSLYSNMVCDQFYINDGDAKNYVIFTDVYKHVYFATMSGGNILLSMKNPDSSGILTAIAADAQAAEPYTYTYGNDEIVVDNNFDLNGEHAVIFFAGNYTYAYSSDDDTQRLDLSGYLHTTTKTPLALRMTGQINFGASKNGVAVYTSGGEMSASPTARTFIGLIKQTKNLFGVRILSMANSAYILGGNPSCIIGTYNINIVRDRINPGATVDDLIIFDDHRNKESSGGNCGVNNHASIAQINAKSFNTTFLTYFSVALGGAAAPVGSPLYRGFTIDGNGDGYRDALMVTTTTSPPDGQSSISLIYGSGAYLGYYLPERNIFYNFSRTLSAPAIYTPTPIDVNGDGILDLVLTEPTRTTVFLTSQFVGAGFNLPFTVTLNNTLPYTSIQKILVGFNTTSGIYNYAAVCDLTKETYWNEQFRTGYNFSTRNTSLNVAPPEQFLTYNSLTFPITGIIPQFDFTKTGNAGQRDYMEQHIEYTSSANSTLDYLAFADNNLLTYWLRFTKVGTSVQIDKVLIGGTVINIANYTITTGYNDVTISYAPTHDIGLNIDYFTTRIKNGNATIIDDSTVLYDGANIKDIELFSDAVNTTLTFYSVGLFQVSNPRPAFVQFQNGQRIENNGFIIESAPPASNIVGDGYTVIADYNERFYSVCEYENVGTYTQRHFIAPINSINYANYHDLTVSVTNVSGTGTGTSDGLTPVGENVLTDFFSSILGVTSPITAFIFWLVITLILTMLAFKVHVVFGGLTFIVLLTVGTVVGFVPLWVIILLAIFAGGIIVSGWYRIFTGGN